MTSQELTIEIVDRLKKHKFIITGFAVFVAAILALYALKTPVTYTSKSTIFPLTGGGDNNATSSALSALFSGGDNTSSFTDDASVNIVELALSRTTREEVAAMRDSARGNKTFAELLLEDINNHRSFLEKKLEIPKDSPSLIIAGARILQGGLGATINKNNSFVLNYTGRSPYLVREISYGFIDKISSFYIDLKREKAKRDYEFATKKVDSLKGVINSKDKQLIAIDQRTLFTNTDKMEFRVPTENLINDKQMLRQQYAVAIANQQNAAYKLQKATPVMKVLDTPDPPYDVQNKSPLIYGIFGFIIGLIFIMLFFSANLLIRFAASETRKAIYGEESLNTPATAESVS